MLAPLGFRQIGLMQVLGDLPQTGIATTHNYDCAIVIASDIKMEPAAVPPAGTNLRTGALPSHGAPVWCHVGRRFGLAGLLGDIGCEAFGFQFANLAI
jgi:hypothetical protein